MNRPKIYLAGPDVFLPDPLETAARKKEILDHHGFEGVHPFDNEILPDGLSAQQIAQLIKDKNCEMMRNADGILANLTPFRGPSADVGTAYEIGFMDALQKPLYAYSNVPAPYFERIENWNGGALTKDGDHWRDAQGMSVENFGLFDNLMLGCALRVKISVAPVAEDIVNTDLTAFAAAAENMAKDFPR